jgi:hypothetical protein
LAFCHSAFRHCGHCALDFADFLYFAFPFLYFEVAVHGDFLDVDFEVTISADYYVVDLRGWTIF